MRKFQLGLLASRRGICIVGTAAFAVTVGGGGIAQAASNFGGLQYSPSLNTYGGQVNIKVPAVSSESVGTGEILVHRVTTQSNGTNAGLIQAGIYRSGTNGALDTCASSINAYQYYSEYKTTTSSTYMCHLYGQAPSGDEVNAFVANVGDDGGQDWEADTEDETTGNGGYIDPETLGFTTGFTDISTEINGGTATVAADGSTASTVYGAGSGQTSPDTGTGWYIFSTAYDNNTGTPIHITTSSQAVQEPHVNSGVTGTVGTWSVPEPNTPLTITHTP